MNFVKISIAIIFALTITSSMLFSQIKSDTVILGKDYVNEVWYNIEFGKVSDFNNNDWDLAFETGQRGGIHVNGAKGVRAWVVPNKTPDDFNKPIDTTGMAETWEYHTNSDETWSIGALNLGLDGYVTDGDFGWGAYDLATHSIAGTKLFVIKLNNNTYKKFYVEALYAQEYSFIYANLDGTDEAIGKVDKKKFAGKNLAYYSIANNASIDRDPLAKDWQLTFGKYEVLVPAGEGKFLPYPVTGVRQNKGIRVAKVTGVDPKTAPSPEWNELNYFLKITSIGSDWKTFNNATFQYDLKKDWVYFLSDDSIQNLHAQIYRIYFTGFEGSTTGKIMFEKEQLAVSVIENNGVRLANFSIYPNVVSTGNSLNVVINSKDAYKDVIIEIISSEGNVVYSQNSILTADLNALTIPNLKLAAGMYFVKTTINNSFGIEKLIIQ